jgi:hypothetical protein
MFSSTAAGMPGDELLKGMCFCLTINGTASDMGLHVTYFCSWKRPIFAESERSTEQSIWGEVTMS